VGGGKRGYTVRPRALLAADCGSGVGLGHLERMLALADALRADLDVSIVVPQGDAAVRDRVSDRGHVPLETPGDTPARVAAAVSTIDTVDVLVLDGYVFDVALQHRLRQRAPLTVVDDLCLPTDCDLAVNPSPGGEAMRPSGADGFLGGPAFALLRASFADAREQAPRRGRDSRTVLVSSGATDLAGIGGRVTRALLDGDSRVKVVRVVGPDTPGVAGRDHDREQLLIAPPSLAEPLSQASVYVGAAGTTAVQAACVGTPAIITAAVPNQQAQAAALAAAGCAMVVEVEDLASTCLQLLDDSARRDDMATRGRALVDGRGAERVADAIRQLVAARAA
jgi:UDP-2,4-diacetamido-2,4,6-trideoxy-beta-L-altropyranose hydrolase